MYINPNDSLSTEGRTDWHPYRRLEGDMMAEQMCPIAKRSCKYNYMNKCESKPDIVDEKGKKVCRAYRIKI